MIDVADDGPKPHSPRAARCRNTAALSAAIPIALKARSLPIEHLHSVLIAIHEANEHDCVVGPRLTDVVAWLCDHPDLVYYDDGRWALRTNHSTITPTAVAVREWPEDGGVAGDSRRL